MLQVGIAAMMMAVVAVMPGIMMMLPLPIKNVTIRESFFFEGIMLLVVGFLLSL